MIKRLTPTILLATLALAAAACADGPTLADEPPDTTVPPTTPEPAAPPTAVPPATDPPTTIAPVEPELPERYVEIDDGAFGSIGEMADASDVVVVATVTGRQPVTSDRDDVVPSADELVDIRLRVDEVLRGDPGDEIRLTWFAYQLGDDGEPAATNLLNGIPVPQPGDRLVLFLRTVSEDEALVGDATHAPVLLDGIGYLDGDAVTITDDVVPDAAVLTGATLDEIRDSIRSEISGS